MKEIEEMTAKEKMEIVYVLETKTKYPYYYTGYYNEKLEPGITADFDYAALYSCKHVAEYVMDIINKQSKKRKFKVEEHGW